LASVGIIGLGLLPTLGSPDRPLHWAMTAGMIGFGALLAVRHRLRRFEAQLAPVPQSTAQRAGRTVLWVTGVIGAMVVVIVLQRLTSGGPIALLSIAMPIAGLAWLASLGLKARRWPADPSDASTASNDRPSRRPPAWERLTPTGPSPPGDPGRHASA